MYLKPNLDFSVRHHQCTPCYYFNVHVLMKLTFEYIYIYISIKMHTIRFLFEQFI